MPSTSDVSTTARSDARERILAGLSTCLHSASISELTVAQVLTQSDVSRRTFYKYFHSLNDALLTLYRGVANDLAQHVLQAIGHEGDLVVRVRSGAMAYLDFQLSGGPTLYALQREATVPGTLLNPVHNEVMDGMVAFLVHETSRVSGLAPDPLVYRGLLLGIEGVILHTQRGGTFTRADRDRLARIMEPFLLGVLRSAPSWARAED